MSTTLQTNELTLRTSIIQKINLIFNDEELTTISSQMTLIFSKRTTISNIIFEFRREVLRLKLQHLV